MALPNLAGMRTVAARLDQLGVAYAFVGGSIVNLLLDHPTLSPARPTDDVDVILETIASLRYSQFEEKLRAVGFAHDMREKAPKCRWVLGDLTVDLMPIDGAFLGLNTLWFAEALASATEQTIAHSRLKLISPAAFLATKYAAFVDRAAGDYYASADIEDFITVIDGRAKIVAEIDSAAADLRRYLAEAVRELHANAAFDEALPGHLPPDRANQLRLPGLRQKLKTIAELD